MAPLPADCVGLGAPDPEPEPVPEAPVDPETPDPEADPPEAVGTEEPEGMMRLLLFTNVCKCNQYQTMRAKLTQKATL